MAKKPTLAETLIKIFSDKALVQSAAEALQTAKKNKKIVTLFNLYEKGDRRAEKSLDFLDRFYGSLCHTRLVNFFLDGKPVEDIFKDIIYDIKQEVKRTGEPDMDYMGLSRMFHEIGKVVNNLEDAVGKVATERDQVIPDEKSEAPPQAALGRIAFGEERLDRVPWEKDTKKEKQLFRAIDRQLHDNIPLADEYTDMIAGFLKAGNYSKIFKEPKTQVVYRGMTVSEQWLKSALKLDKDVFLLSRGGQDASFVFTPKKGNASSWSTSKTVAGRFSARNPAKWAIILHASVEDNPRKFADLSRGFYNLDGMNEYEDEKEAIGMGRIKVFRITWQKLM